MALIVRLPELMLPNIGDFVFNMQQTFFFAYYLVREKVKHKSLIHGRGIFTRGIKPLLPTLTFKPVCC